MKEKRINILLVEDNPGDARLAYEAVQEGKIPSNLYVVNDGVEALEFLDHRNMYFNSPKPDLIILDLNLPKKHGKEVLAEIKNDPKLKRIPVIVFSISYADEDIKHCYQLHANCYIIKPLDLNEFLQVVKSIQDFWFTTVKLPENNLAHYIREKKDEND